MTQLPLDMEKLTPRQQTIEELIHALSKKKKMKLAADYLRSLLTNDRLREKANVQSH